jgi:hypothetical protein
MHKIKGGVGLHLKQLHFIRPARPAAAPGLLQHPVRAACRPRKLQLVQGGRTTRLAHQQMVAVVAPGQRGGAALR